MSTDPSSDVMNPKAVIAAQASVNELKSFIAQHRRDLRRVTSNLTAETSLGSLRRRALESIRSEKIQEVSGLAGRTPDFDSFDPYPHAGPVVSQTGGGWALNPALVRAFEEAARTARSNFGAPPKKTFTDRLFRDADGTRSRAAEGGIETMCRIVASVSEEIRQLDNETQDGTARRHGEARALRQAAEERLTAMLNTYADVQSRLPAPLLPWANEAWDEWMPAQSPPELFAGLLKPRHDGTLGENGDFGRDVVLPLYVRPTAGLHLVAHRGNREATHALARALLVRSLAAHPPGTLHLTVFDPIGLGQSVAPLLELAEYDQELLGGKIWSSASDFKMKLTEMTAHVELVVQKFLRSDFATLAEFNAAAGEVATPYRLLVVFDFPTHFDQESFGDLRRIIETGPRCGVGTLLVTNSDEPLPHGVELAALPKTMTRINMAAPFLFSGPSGYELICDFEPDSDRALSSTILDRIVESIGGQARDRGDQSVGFEKVFGLFSSAALEGRKRGLPRITAAVDVGDPSTWWSQTTVESVAAPIGLRGARDVAVLRFDSSDHSGALLVGRPGSGKSTLLHTFIGGITTMYGPQELELHLIDFKEGVEFKVYAANVLPHARTVAIESDREFGVSVLQAIQAELAWRGSLLRGSTESHSSLEALRKATGEQLPRIVLIFDEFQVLFARNDKLGAVAAEALETLIRQGRGFGIHVLLGSQSLSGLDALGSHVPQLLPVRILLPAADSDVFKVLGEGNTEGTTLTTAGEGILNMSGGAVEANERFRGAVIDEEARRSRVAAMRTKADAEGFNRRPVVFEGNAPIPAEDTPPAQFVDEIRGADARTLRLRFGAPMAIAGSADINLRRESGANVLLVARDAPIDTGTFDPFSAPRAVTANVTLSAVARRASVEIVDFLPIDEGLETFVAPLLKVTAVNVSRRRQVPDLLKRIRTEVKRRIDEDDTSSPATFLVLYGMHRARDFDQDSVDYDTDADLPELVSQIMRDGPEVGVHTFLWFDTVASISRRLPSSAVREASWRLAGKMSADDSSSFIGVDGASSLREQQLLAVNEDRGVTQRCTTIAEPTPQWTQDLLTEMQDKPKEPNQ
jgi:S-DNA-T family DNA segregation ATPase FtsK/SpoIIIE